MAILWNTFAIQYDTTRGTAVYATVEEEFQRTLFPYLSHFTPHDILWLTEALANEHQKWFVAFVCRHVPTLPEPLFAPLIWAAVHERNPSFNRQFIEPCLATFGVRRVISALLDILFSDLWCSTGHKCLA